MIENLWFQDFPKLNGSEISLGPVASEFCSYLKDFVNSLHVMDNLSFLDNYNYQLAKVFLVASVPGVYSGSHREKWGHLRMRSLLSRFNWPSELMDIPTDIQTSNIGQLDKEWLQQVCESLHCGAKSHTNIRIIFPTRKTMESSSHKEHGWYFYWTYNSNDANDLLYDTQDERFPGLLLHSKIYKQCDSKGVGWIYAGGHNL
jgi:hypothetical protein